MTEPQDTRNGYLTCEGCGKTRHDVQEIEHGLNSIQLCRTCFKSAARAMRRRDKPNVVVGDE